MKGSCQSNPSNIPLLAKVALFFFRVFFLGAIVGPSLLGAVRGGRSFFSFFSLSLLPLCLFLLLLLFPPGRPGCPFGPAPLPAPLHVDTSGLHATTKADALLEWERRVQEESIRFLKSKKHS